MPLKVTDISRAGVGFRGAGEIFQTENVLAEGLSESYPIGRKTEGLGKFTLHFGISLLNTVQN